jgi:hypothetical protein
MARQVLTIPDVPPTLLQKTTADSLYATVGHNHNAAYVAKGGDTMTGALTMTPGDGLVALTANVRSGANAGSLVIQEGVTGLGNPRLLSAKTLEIDAASVLPSRDNAIDFGHPAFRWGNAHARYLSLTPTSGGTALVAMGNVGINVTPEAWHANAPAIRIGARGAINGAAASGMTLRENSYFDGVEKAIAAAPASYVNLTNGTVTIATAPGVGVAGAALTHTVRVSVAQTGGVTITPDAGATVLNLSGLLDFYYESGTGHLLWRRNNGASTVARSIYSVPGLFMVEPIKPYTDGGVDCGENGNRWRTVYANQISAGSPGGALVLGTTSSLQLSFGGYGHPLTDNSMHWGHPSYRFAVVYSAGGVVTTSHVSKKEGFSLLNPEVCASAVLDTDWYEFDYKVGEGVKASVQEETAFSRHQRGYVLGSPDHRVSDLFGLADRHSASSGSDLAVVACALQGALKRIAALEARPA